MKTKLTPLALLIPAVVLAQQAPAPPSQDVMPPPSMMPAPPVNPANPVNPAKAAAALSTAKHRSANLKGNLSSSREFTSTVDGKCPNGYSYTFNEEGSRTCVK
jgi:hypothetical protein